MLIACCLHGVCVVFVQPSVWNTELGYDGGSGLQDFVDLQDGSLGQHRGAGAGYPRIGVINGLAVDLASGVGLYVFI